MKHDLSRWPLVVGVEGEESGLDRYRRFLDAWNDWLARGERFAVLRVLLRDEALTPTAETTRLGKQWMTENAGRVSAHVAGIATVLPPASYARFGRMNTERAFGVPGGNFADLDAAIDWLQDVVFATGGAWPRATAVRSTVSRLSAGH